MNFKCTLVMYPSLSLSYSLNAISACFPESLGAAQALSESEGFSLFKSLKMK